ncbi:MAG: TonB-dependent receptor, partial [Phenylobacterium zucineum]
MGGASALLLAWFGASSASADDVAPTALEEIIVTATRSNQSLSKVPLSVAAYTQERIDRQGVKSVADIARLTPGLVFTQGSTVSTHGRSRISIRGISSTTGAATTGVYLDESPIQVRNAGFTSSNVYPETFDLERIEVLRGPQGTLFGAGSQGGTVRFITPQPSLTRYQVYARSEASMIQGGDPGAELGVAVGGPIVADELGFRASVFYRHTGGYMDRVDPFTGNIVDRNSNRDSALVARVALTWAPTEALKITPSVYAQDLNANNGAPFGVSLSAPSERKFKSANLLSSPSRDRLILPAVNIDYRAPGFTLVSNSSFFQRDVDNFPDCSQWQHNISIGNPFVKSVKDFSRGIYE